MEGAVVRTLTGTAENGYEFELLLPRASHAIALDEVRAQLAALGYAITDAAISEWATRSTEVAVTCALAGGGGGAFTRNPMIALVAAGVGYVAGHVAGAYIHEEISRFRARHDPLWAVWEFIAIPLPTTPRYRFGSA
jgi:hypothetical protein